MTRWHTEARDQVQQEWRDYLDAGMPQSTYNDWTRKAIELFEDHYNLTCRGPKLKRWVD